MTTAATTTNGTPEKRLVQWSPARQIVETKRPEFSAYLPEPKELERFIASATFAIGRNPNILKCSQASILAAVFTAAELRLDFTPALGLAYMVPYGQECQFQIGYRGLGTLAIRAGTIIAFEAHVVHANDTFEHEIGTGAFIKHHRPKLGENRGDMIGAYAIVTLPTGGKQFDIMDKHEIGRIQARSKSKGGPWTTDTAEMWKKTVSKRLCKYLNLSPDIGRALEADGEDTESGPHQESAPVVRPDKIDALIEQAPESAPSRPGDLTDAEKAAIRDREAAEQ